jgi:hypothetical protein
MMIDQLPTHFSSPHNLTVIVYLPSFVVLHIGAIILENRVAATTGTVVYG